MTAYQANILNASVLLICSLWAFITLEKTSFTALIPAAFGAALFLCARGIKSHQRATTVVATLLTLIVLCALYVPLASALEGSPDVSVLRVGLMITTSLIAATALLGAAFRGSKTDR